MNTEPFQKPLVLLARMRSKLLVLLLSPHFQRVWTNELLLLMKWTWAWWLFIFAILFKVIYSIFSILFYFPKWGNFSFSHLGNIFFRTVNKTSARDWTLWCPSLTDWDRPFSVERWKGRVLWGKRWLEELFISRQCRHFYFWCYTFKQYFSLFVPWLAV